MIKQLLAIPALMAIVMSTSYAASKQLDALDTGASPVVKMAVVPEKPTVYEVSGKLYALIVFF